MRDRPLMRGRGLVVFLRHFRAAALFENQLLLREEIVRKDPIVLPNLVQYRQLGSRVVTERPDKFPQPGPVLLFDMRAIVAVARTGPGERDFVVKAVL